MGHVTRDTAPSHTCVVKVTAVLPRRVVLVDDGVHDLELLLRNEHVEDLVHGVGVVVADEPDLQHARGREVVVQIERLEDPLRLVVVD